MPIRLRASDGREILICDEAKSHEPESHPARPWAHRFWVTARVLVKIRRAIDSGQSIAVRRGSRWQAFKLRNLEVRV